MSASLPRPRWPHRWLPGLPPTATWSCCWAPCPWWGCRWGFAPPGGQRRAAGQPWGRHGAARRGAPAVDRSGTAVMGSGSDSSPPEHTGTSLGASRSPVGPTALGHLKEEEDRQKGGGVRSRSVTGQIMLGCHTCGEEHDGLHAGVLGGVYMQGLELLHLLLEGPDMVHEGHYLVCGHGGCLQPGRC